MTVNTHTVYFSLGANIGDKEDNLRRAVEGINIRIGEVVRQSSFYYSQPWGFVSPNSFVNLCICCETVLSPHEVLEATKSIEKELGRTEKSAKGEYHDRLIDIDILLYDDEHIDEPELKIPHPLMQERDFVMVPLREIMHR